MSFAKSSSSRFEGPGSYLGRRSKDAGSHALGGVLTPSRNSQRSVTFGPGFGKSKKTAGKNAMLASRKQTPARPPSGGKTTTNENELPAYMRGTASSARKKSAPGSAKKKVTGGRTLAWDAERGEGADTFYSPVNKTSGKSTGGVSMDKQSANRHGYIKASQGEGRGETIGAHGSLLQQSTSAHSKGGRNFRRGKHGRFSMAGSYLLASRGHGGQGLGRSHGELADSGTKKGTILGMQSKVDRFEGKDSYIVDAKGDAVDVDYKVGHGAPVSEQGGVAVKYVPEKSFSRTNWMKKNTILSDKDLTCGNDISGNVVSDFKGKDDHLSRAKVGSAFGGASNRFEDKVLDEGQIALGKSHDDLVEVIEGQNCPVNYNTKKKHGRFSEVGTMYHGLKGNKGVFRPKLPYGGAITEAFAEEEEEEEEEEMQPVVEEAGQGEELPEEQEDETSTPVDDESNEA